VISFRAAYLEELDSPLVIEEIISEAPLSFGQVLIRVEAMGICGSQLLEMSGKKGNKKFLPHLLGHEGVGVVEETGEGVTKVQSGDRVVMHWRKAMGLEGAAARFKGAGNKTIGSGPIAVFGEMAIVSENRVTKIRNEVNSTLATLLGCSLSTGLGAVDKEIRLNLGATVLVLGAGGVGLAAAMGASLKGAGQIVVVDAEDWKRVYVESIPGTTFVSTKEGNWKDSTQLLAQGGYDFVIEATGSDLLRRGGLAMLADGGTMISLGQGEGTDEIRLGNQKNAFGANGTSVIFSQGGAFNPDLDIARYEKVLSRNLHLLASMSETTVGGLENLNGLLESLRTGRSLRPILQLRD